VKTNLPVVAGHRRRGRVPRKLCHVQTNMASAIESPVDIFSSSSSLSIKVVVSSIESRFHQSGRLSLSISVGLRVRNRTSRARCKCLRLERLCPFRSGELRSTKRFSKCRFGRWGSVQSTVSLINTWKLDLTRKRALSGSWDYSIGIAISFCHGIIPSSLVCSGDGI
jgi:hypothetical protein